MQLCSYCWCSWAKWCKTIKWGSCMATIKLIKRKLNTDTLAKRSQWSTHKCKRRTKKRRKRKKKGKKKRKKNGKVCCHDMQYIRCTRFTQLHPLKWTTKLMKFEKLKWWRNSNGKSNKIYSVGAGAGVPRTCRHSIKAKTNPTVNFGNLARNHWRYIECE